MVSPFWIKSRRGGPFSQQITSRHTHISGWTPSRHWVIWALPLALSACLPKYSTIRHNSNCMFKSSAHMCFLRLSNFWEWWGFLSLNNSFLLLATCRRSGLRSQSSPASPSLLLAILGAEISYCLPYASLQTSLPRWSDFPKKYIAIHDSTPVMWAVSQRCCDCNETMALWPHTDL